VRNEIVHIADLLPRLAEMRSLQATGCSSILESSGRRSQDRRLQGPEEERGKAAMSIEPARSKLQPLAPVLLVLLSACSSPPPPPVVLPELAESRERIPVVLVPGVTGVTLQERDSGKTVWGRGVNLIRPHDGGYELALPIASGEVGRTKLEPGKVIEEVRLAGVFRKSVYRPIVELLEANGYRHGDLSDPGPGDDLFLYAYDWRQDNIRSARRLAELLEQVRRARGQERLPVALLCQSSGAHICRWLIKFGKASLEEAEAGRVEKPEGVDVVKVILAGTSSGGSLRVLREMDRGRSYVRLVGRNWRPEVPFTFPALYQDLPGYRRDLFVDEAGQDMDVDLFDAESWSTYGWSAFGRETRERLERRQRPDLFGDTGARTRFLRRTLGEALRFQRLLRQDVPGFGPVQYYLVQNVHRATPSRAVLMRKKGEWKTFFTGDPAVEGSTLLRDLVTEPGDGHATRESQLHLSPQERESFAAEPLHVQGDHFELILDPVAQRRLLDFLLDDGLRAGEHAARTSDEFDSRGGRSR
jgi:hypothetical protein